jgi:hypothetical protein
MSSPGQSRQAAPGPARTRGRSGGRRRRPQSPPRSGSIHRPPAWRRAAGDSQVVHLPENPHRYSSRARLAPRGRCHGAVEGGCERATGEQDHVLVSMPP